MIFALLFLWFAIKARPSKEREAYWNEVVEQGREFLVTLKYQKIKVEEIGELEPATRKKVIQHLGYDPQKIEDFFILVEEFPKADLMKISRNRTVYKGVPAWQGYRITRQSLRRWPGYSSTTAGIHKKQ